MNIRKTITIASLTSLGTVFSYFFLDHPIALGFQRLLTSYARPKAFSINLPDLLLPIAGLVTVLAWTGYLVLWRRHQSNRSMPFLKVIGTSVPAAFVLKTVSKGLFGRISTRAWLNAPGSDGFHWFQGQDLFNGFPSGHMAVFTVLFAALWDCDPGHRRAYFGLLALIGCALIVTDYHFVSDVLAGTGLGLLVHAGVDRLLAQKAEQGR